MLRRTINYMRARLGTKTTVTLLVTLSLFVLGMLTLIVLSLWPPHQIIVDPPPVDQCAMLLSPSSYPFNGSGFTVMRSPLGKPEYIGVSDGSFIFDTTRANREQKCQGAIQFRANTINDIQLAGDHWTKAVVLQDRSGFQQEDSNDAEALIYRENSDVLSSGLPYITFIVGTILTGDDKNIGYDILQGAYVAQEEFNRTHNDRHGYPLQIRLLIANFSSNVLETPDQGKSIEDSVARMIITMAGRKELKVKGILLGLPFTFDNTLTILNQSNIPVVLSGAFSKPQIQNSGNIFPVAASTQHEGQVAAQYVQQYLKARKIALFVDENSLYSKSLADAFQGNMNKETIWSKEVYTSRDTDSINNGVLSALRDGVDLIYFAGDAHDANTALDMLQQRNASVEFMGGDALYELSSYTGEHYRSLYFTSFAFPDEWQQPNLLEQHPLPTLYRLLFGGWPLGRVYGYIRPDSNALLSYDGLSTLLYASEIVFSSQHNDNFSFNDLQQALMHIKDQQAFQGFSGRISFGFDQDSKAIVILYVDSNGLTRMVHPHPIYGCLIVTCKPV